MVKSSEVGWPPLLTESSILHYIWDNSVIMKSFAKSYKSDHVQQI